MTQKESANSDEEKYVNPFPGLWHYRVSQSPYYFIDVKSQNSLLSRLVDNNFLALVGEPGSGKASLLNCGIVPRLTDGFIGKGGDKWEFTILRPGTNPIRNLAEHLAHAKVFFGGGKVEPNFEDQLEEILRSSSNGLVEIFDRYTIKDGYNLFLAIDELEDIFILKDLVNDEEDNRAFVNLLLRFLQKGHPSVYVICALASDYLGESAQYPGLTEAINRGQYLLTIPDHVQLKKLLHHVSRNFIAFEEDFTDYIWADYRDKKVNIYQVQYGLKRLVDHWINSKSRPPKITLNYYNSLGPKVNVLYAIEAHAEEIYEGFTSAQQQICEVLFKAITKEIDHGIEQSLAIEVHRLAKMAECTTGEMIEVITKFAEEEFDLMHVVPSDEVVGRLQALSNILESSFTEITAYSKIMLLSPAFVQSWEKLRIWKREEYGNAELFSKLVEAEKYYRNAKVKEDNLYTNAELTAALWWRDNEIHNAEWASRYALGYEQALEFLEKSETKRNNDQEAVQRDEARLKRKRFWTFTGLSAACVVFLALAGWAVKEQSIAHRAKEKVEQERKRLNFIQDLDSIHTIYIDILEDIERSEVTQLFKEIENPESTRASVLQFANDMISIDQKCKDELKERIAGIDTAKYHWRTPKKEIDTQLREQRLHKDSILIHNICIVLDRHCSRQSEYITFYQKVCNGMDSEK